MFSNEENILLGGSIMKMNFDKKQMETIGKFMASGACFFVSGLCFSKASYYKGKADAYRDCEQMLRPFKKYTEK